MKPTLPTVLLCCGIVVGTSIALLYLYAGSVATARALAQTQPIFGLAGVDPERLRDEVLRLREAALDLARHQDNPRDAILVATSLFPTHFLYSLASLEDARQRFVASGSLISAVRYNIVLRATLWYGLHDAAAFERALAAVNSGQPPLRWVSAAGVTSDLRIVSAAGATLQHMQEVSVLYKKQRGCILHSMLPCLLGQEDVLSNNSPQWNPDKIPSMISRTKAVLGGADGQAQQVVVLNSSVCAPALGAPYYFIEKPLTFGPNDDTPGIQPKLLNDIFFTSLGSTTGATAMYLRDTMGVSYSVVNPMVFYVCPGVLSDMGAIRAVMFAAQTAHNYPDIAARERAAMLATPGIVTETAARAYSKAALVAAPTNPAVITAARMFEEGSAGLEDLLKYMTHVFVVDIERHDNGVSFDLSARTLFLTHSAFASLFLTSGSYDTDSRTDPFVLDREARDAFKNKFLRYSDLQYVVSEEKLLHDIRALADFHTAF